MRGGVRGGGGERGVERVGGGGKHQAVLQARRHNGGAIRIHIQSSTAPDTTKRRRGTLCTLTSQGSPGLVRGARSHTPSTNHPLVAVLNSR